MSKRQNKWILGEMTVKDFKSQECTRHRKIWKQKSNWSPEQGQLGPQESATAGDRTAVKDGEYSIIF